MTLLGHKVALILLCSAHVPESSQTSLMHHHYYVPGWKGRLVGPWTARTSMFPCLSMKVTSSPDTLLTFMSVEQMSGYLVFLGWFEQTQIGHLTMLCGCQCQQQ